MVKVVKPLGLWFSIGGDEKFDLLTSLTTRLGYSLALMPKNEFTMKRIKLSQMQIAVK